MQKMILIILILLFIISGFIYYRYEEFENEITEVVTEQQKMI